LLFYYEILINEYIYKKKSSMNLNLFHNKKGSVPVVFLHGNSLDHTVFKHQFHSDIINCFTLDLPGHGFSPKMDGYSLTRIVDIICTFLNSTFDSEYFIVAHSLSGHLILQGLEKLKNVKGVILVGTPPLSSISDMGKVFNPVPSQLLFATNWNEKELNVLSELYSTLNPDVINSALLKCDPIFKKDFLREDFLAGFKDEQEIILKTYLSLAITWGVDDPFINIEYLKKMANGIKRGNLSFHEFAKGGHTPFLDNHDLFNSFIINFTG
jgi:pimeloyl-ACP methyl ester carboxylesterase